MNKPFTIILVISFVVHLAVLTVTYAPQIMKEAQAQGIFVTLGQPHVNDPVKGWSPKLEREIQKGKDYGLFIESLLDLSSGTGLIKRELIASPGAMASKNMNKSSKRKSYEVLNESDIPDTMMLSENKTKKDKVIEPKVKRVPENKKDTYAKQGSEAAVDSTLPALTKVPTTKFNRPERKPLVRTIPKEVARHAPVPNEYPVVKRFEPTGQGHVLGNTTRTDIKTEVVNYEKIISLWLEKYRKYPRLAFDARMEGKAKIYIRIDREGSILSWGIVEPSGSMLLDGALAQMILDAKRVPPVPRNYAQNTDSFTFEIDFNFDVYKWKEDGRAIAN